MVLDIVNYWLVTQESQFGWPTAEIWPKHVETDVKPKTNKELFI